MGLAATINPDILLMEWDGKRLRELRDLRGWTQIELGESAGIEPSNISRWEKGKARPGFDDVVKLADALRVSVEAFRQPVGQRPIRSRFKPEQDDE